MKIVQLIFIFPLTLTYDVKKYDETLDYKIAKKYGLFPLALIKYKITYPWRDTSANDKVSINELVETAIGHIERLSCLTFVRISSRSQEYSAHVLEIKVSNFSFQDRRFRFTPKPEDRPDRNAVVEISISENYYSVISRLLNAVAGLQYEHQREDRDNYVKIFWDNIVQGYEGEFTKITGYPPNITELKDFSYGSVMSVEDTYRSVNTRNGTPTIQYIGRGTYHNPKLHNLSDIRRVNAIYRQLIHRWYFYGNLFLYKGPLECFPELE